MHELWMALAFLGLLTAPVMVASIGSKERQKRKRTEHKVLPMKQREQMLGTREAQTLPVRRSTGLAGR